MSRKRKREELDACGTSTAIVFRGGQMSCARMYCHKVLGTDACPTCRGRRVDKVLSTVIEHQQQGPLYMRACTADEAKLVTKAVRHIPGTWYVQAPQQDGTVVVIASHNKRLGGVELGPDVVPLVKGILDTPKTKRVSTHRGSEQDKKSKAEKKARRVSAGKSVTWKAKTDVSVVEWAAERLGAKWTGESGDYQTYELDERRQSELLEKLREFGVVLVDPDGERSASPADTSDGHR